VQIFYNYHVTDVSTSPVVTGELLGAYPPKLNYETLTINAVFIKFQDVKPP